MDMSYFICFIFLFNFHSFIVRGSKFSSAKEIEKNKLQAYVVRVEQPDVGILGQADNLDVGSWHKSFLPLHTASSDTQPRMVYSYKTVISGFAARLTEEEVQAMRTKKGFISAHPQRILRKQTTHTPRFLGLQQELGIWKESNFGKGVIIGVLDGGVLLDHPSFSDEGMPPPPEKWKGKCEFTACNNKIIGGRSFNIDGNMTKGKVVEPPNDEDGHGTHTASTAAGRFVNYADVLGNAKGMAAGMAPLAHLAIYKVCFGEDCAESNILAALDAAIEEGVDVLSLSLGEEAVPFFQDSIAIGGFAAMKNGIFVSCSAGNSGPSNTTLSNEAPWLLTVGASTIGRKIVATAKLGNGEEFDGESIFQPNDFPSKLLQLVYAGMNGKQESALCGEGTLKGIDVKGKVVLCERGGGIARIAKGQEVKNAGGAAMILMNQETDGFSVSADVHVLPTTHQHLQRQSYLEERLRRPVISLCCFLFVKRPQPGEPGILKPDIIGPGVNILAAWPFPLDNNINSKSTFNIMSGTSMSCPHLSGIAALLKSSHPTWSPAAIKSAMMTSTDLFNIGGKLIVDETLQPADVFATGAGHMIYIPYLCGLGYKDEEVGIIAHRSVKCSEKPSIPEGELNYPSFSIKLGPSQTYTRTVTNVGEANSAYEVNGLGPKRD
ncbi:hypothetical protein GOBAR_DD12214 [Gossypium barbadense]|nr:hypothetical protein GOBAR_DD12214 [Gossypium barbadense]